MLSKHLQKNFSIDFRDFWKKNFFPKILRKRKFSKKLSKFSFKDFPLKRNFSCLSSLISSNEEKISHKIKQNLRKTKKEVIALSKNIFRAFWIFKV